MGNPLHLPPSALLLPGSSSPTLLLANSLGMLQEEGVQGDQGNNPSRQQQTKQGAAMGWAPMRLGPIHPLLLQRRREHSAETRNNHFSYLH